MRISDLSRQAGIPVATIKFYLREHLLPPGIPTGRNQADYGDVHLRRLGLIRAFTGLGRLELSTVKTLLAAIEDDTLSLAMLYEVVNRTLYQGGAETLKQDDAEPAAALGIEQARADVDGFTDQLGWQVDCDTPGRDRLIHVLATLRCLGCERGVDFFLPYAEMAEQLANQELDLLPEAGVDIDRAAAVTRTILLEVAMTATRRMAQEHCVRQREPQLGGAAINHETIDGSR
jgi:DNA-binding transcriptional MerR regulator